MESVVLDDELSGFVVEEIRGIKDAFCLNNRMNGNVIHWDGKDGGGPGQHSRLPDNDGPGRWEIRAIARIQPGSSFLLAASGPQCFTWDVAGAECRACSTQETEISAWYFSKKPQPSKWIGAEELRRKKVCILRRPQQKGPGLETGSLGRFTKDPHSLNCLSALRQGLLYSSWLSTGRVALGQ